MTILNKNQNCQNLIFEQTNLNSILQHMSRSIAEITVRAFAMVWKFSTSSKSLPCL